MALADDREDDGVEAYDAIMAEDLGERGNMFTTIANLEGSGVNTYGIICNNLGLLEDPSGY
jgi:hypothetical protein